MAPFYARLLHRRFDAHELNDPLQLERPLLAPQVAVGHEHQLPVRTSHVQGLNHALGGILPGIKILHPHRLSLLERFFKLQGKQAFPRADGEQSHRAALLADRVAQAHPPPADRLHQPLEYRRRGLRVGQRPVCDARVNPQSRRQRLQTISPTPEPPPRDPHRVEHGRVAQRLDNLPPAAPKFLP